MKYVARIARIEHCSLLRVENARLPLDNEGVRTPACKPEARAMDSPTIRANNDPLMEACL
jgi:hypothetical protein